MADNIKKILIRGVNWIGDAVISTPVIKAVREAFPDAYICLLVKPRVADIFKENPNINEIILYDEKFNSIPGKLKLARMLRARGFNSAILLQNAFDAALITWLSGIPERIGYRRDWRRFLLTKAISVYPVRKKASSSLSNGVKKDILKQHQVYYYLNLLKESLNIEARDKEPFIYLNKEEINEAKNLLTQSLDLTSETPLIGVNPGATYGSAKRWMPERFAELISRIINELNGKVVIFGSRSEAEIAKLLTSHPSLPASHLLNMAGKTNLRELAALISECDVMISNDSGPMHIAAALLVPVVAIFGSTDRAITGPFGEGHKTISKDIPCAPCFDRECPEKHIKCMTDITTDDVFSTLQQILPKEKAVFLDRDGTLNEDAGYLNSFSNLKIFDGARKNLSTLPQPSLT
ncbi:MAG: lipopolysaccharide heptosyltransferase II, partial [Candidatus Mariimomonas ferrooxydans]